MISRERLAQLRSTAEQLDGSVYPIRALELIELLDTYHATQLLGGGPARGTLEHRIEELEGTVGELQRKLDHALPASSFTQFSPEPGLPDLCKCGADLRDHSAPIDGVRCCP